GSHGGGGAGAARPRAAPAGRADTPGAQRRGGRPARLDRPRHSRLLRTPDAGPRAPGSNAPPQPAIGAEGTAPYRDARADRPARPVRPADPHVRRCGYGCAPDLPHMELGLNPGEERAAVRISEPVCDGLRIDAERLERPAGAT